MFPPYNAIWFDPTLPRLSVVRLFLCICFLETKIIIACSHFNRNKCTVNLFFLQWPLLNVKIASRGSTHFTSTLSGTLALLIPDFGSTYSLVLALTTIWRKVWLALFYLDQTRAVNQLSNPSSLEIDADVSTWVEFYYSINEAAP